MLRCKGKNSKINYIRISNFIYELYFFFYLRFLIYEHNMSRYKHFINRLKELLLLFVTFLLIILTYGNSYSQKTIKGKILDQETKEPLAYGTVFINNTTKATTSDEFGNFLINDFGLEKFEIVVRYVGYESFTKEINLITQTTLDITIELKSVQNLMGEFEVKSQKDKNWQKQYQQFQKLFFGTSEFAQKCKIENPYEIEFAKTENGLSATSKVPLSITNHGMGYKLILDLKEFHSDGNDYRIISTFSLQNKHQQI